MKTKQKISNNFLQVIKSLTSSVGMVDSKSTGAKLKPADVETVETNTSAKTERKALYTTMSGNQTIKLKKNDSIANILAKIYISMKEDRLELIKKHELDRNFKEEHTKEKKKKYKSEARTKSKKMKGKKDAGDLWGIVIMGLIAESGKIINFIKELIGPWDDFTKKITDGFESVKDYITNQLVDDITEVLKGLKDAILEQVGKVYDGMIGTLETYLRDIVGEKLGKHINLPRWESVVTPSDNTDVTPETPVPEKKAEKIDLKHTEGTGQAVLKGMQDRGADDFQNLGIDIIDKGLQGFTRIYDDVSKNGTGLGQAVVNEYTGQVKQTASQVKDSAGTVVDSIATKAVNDRSNMKKLLADRESKKNLAKEEKPPTDVKPVDPIVDQIPTAPPVVTPNPTTEKYHKEQNKNNDASIEKTKSNKTITLPAKVIPASGGASSGGINVSMSADYRPHEPTLEHIQEKNTFWV